jgi:hypothetical protein
LLRGLSSSARAAAADVAVSEARKLKKTALVDELLRFRAEADGTA